MRKRSQAYHAQTQEEYQQLMQEDDLAQKNNQSLLMQEKPGVIDQIEWLETPDFLENDNKYKLELNTSSDSDGSTSARKKCLIVIDDNQQLNDYFSKTNFPHLFSETSQHKMLELVYSSSEEEMWIHFKPQCYSNNKNSSAAAGKAVNATAQADNYSSVAKQREDSSIAAQNIKNALYCNIIEESFYPYADYIIVFSTEQAKEIQEWKQQKKCRHVKPSQKIYIYNKQKHTFLVENEYDSSESDTSISTSSSPPSSAELSWFHSLKSSNSNSSKQDEFMLQELPSSESSYSSSFSLIKTLLNQA